MGTPNYIFIVCAAGLFLFEIIMVNGQDRRPTISYITQPEIITDIGGTVVMECEIQVTNITFYKFAINCMKV